MAKSDAVRITTARSSAHADLRARQWRYGVSMSIRLVCFLAAVVAWPSAWSWAFAFAAVFVPLFAVVIANAGDQRNDGFMLRDLPAAHELTARDDSDR